MVLRRRRMDRNVARSTNGHDGEMAADAEFHVEVLHEDSGIRVCPVGEVDLATVDALRERMAAAMAAGADRVILDLRATTFLDSNGLHVVLGTDTRARVSGTDFVIIAGPPAVQHTFDAAGLTGQLPFADGTQPLSDATGVQESITASSRVP
jgi:anti-sigma B factor antagonist